MSRRAFLGLGVGALSSALVSCASAKRPSSDDADPASPHTPGSPEVPPAPSGLGLAYATTPPTTLDPALISSASDLAVAYQLYDTLTDYNEAGELAGLAASSWEVNAGGTEFTFHLRQGARFHNGDEVDAGAFVRAWNRLVRPRDGAPAPNAFRLGLVDGHAKVAQDEASHLEGLSAPDPFTLQVRLREPCFDLPARLCHPSLAPLPEFASSATFGRQAVGNGPFALKEPWDGSGDVALVPFSDYWGGPPRMRSLTFVARDDEQEAWEEFRAGRVDVCEVPRDRIAAAILDLGKAPSGYAISESGRTLTGSTLSLLCLVANGFDPCAGDVHVRHALSLALDRSHLAEVTLSGAAQPAYGLAPEALSAELSAWPDARHDPDAANRLLDLYHPVRGEGRRGVALSVGYEAAGPYEGVARLVADLWGALGAEVSTVPLGTDELAAAMEAGACSFVLAELSFPAPSADACLSWLVENPPAGYDSAAVWEHVFAARATSDKDKRAAAFARADALAAQDLPVIPLAFGRLRLAAGPRVERLSADRRGVPRLATATLA